AKQFKHVVFPSLSVSCFATMRLHLEHTLKSSALTADLALRRSISASAIMLRALRSAALYSLVFCWVSRQFKIDQVAFASSHIARSKCTAIIGKTSTKTK